MLRSLKRSREALAVAKIAFITDLLFRSQAWALPTRVPPIDADLDTILNDPWGLAIGGGLIAALLVYGWITYLRAPLLEELAEKREAFLRDLPPDAFGYKGVLYEDEVHYMGRHGVAVYRKIRVSLVHENPAKSKVLLDDQELFSGLNFTDRETNNSAAELWLQKAETQNLPAICATRTGIQKLERRHFAEIKKDPDHFMRQLKSRMWARNALPAN